MLSGPARLIAELGTPRRVLILRALKLGDLLVAVPTLRALRSAWPEAEIVLAGLPWAGSFVRRFGAYLDGFRSFPGWPGLPEVAPDIAAIPPWLAGVQAEGFDLAIQLHGSGSFVNEFIALCGARRSAGFARTGDHRPDPDGFVAWPEAGLEVHRLLALVDALGVPRQGDHLEFPIDDRDRGALDAIEGVGSVIASDYICVHPGASVPERRWPAERFAAAADALADHGLRVVLTGSPGEAHLTRAVADAMRHPTLDLAGRTDLGPLAALIDGSKLLLSNDTGVAHLAVARDVPSVIVSTGDNPARWSPPDMTVHRVLCDDAWGVPVASVLTEAEALLALASPRRGAVPRPALDLAPLGDPRG